MPKQVSEDKLGAFTEKLGVMKDLSEMAYQLLFDDIVPREEVARRLLGIVEQLRLGLPELGPE